MKKYYTLYLNIATTFLSLGILIISNSHSAIAESKRPNIVWMCGEDLGAQLSPYGEKHARYAKTPNIDHIANLSLTYNLAWSNSPVCRPARTALAMGMYAESLGGQHMRSTVSPPPGSKMYSQILSEAGYKTANHGKEDYAVRKTGTLWNSNASLADIEQPFFMKLQYGKLHEGGIRAKMKELKKSKIPRYDLPAFHPDIPEMHLAWHALYKRIEEFDGVIGKWLETMKEHSLMENTIIMIWGDHGPAIARGKRYVRDFGLRVPLIIYIPEKYRSTLAPKEYNPGTKTNRPVSFVDIGPTMLSLAGIEPPPTMQGLPFMGVYSKEPRQYIFGARGRMDERIDMIRTVRNERYQLMRNYMPHLPYGQHIQTLHENLVMNPWKAKTEAGELGLPSSSYWNPKPPVELYDMQNDPDQVKNLADDPNYSDTRKELMAVLHKQQEEIRDIGFVPESQIHSRPAKGQTPYEWAHSDVYDLKRIRTIAELAADGELEAVPTLVESMNDADPAVQYWATLGLLIRGEATIKTHRKALLTVLDIKSAPSARVVAAEALARYGDISDREAALATLLKLAKAKNSESDQHIELAALNVMDRLDAMMLPYYDQIKKLETKGYSKRVLESKLLPDLKKLKEK
ncbi:MAG: sulfatase-like hydrolase/transferase [Verrucomicrobiota bacterium]